MKWYEIKALGDKRASIDIEGEIGWEVTSRQFRRDLAAAGAFDELDVYLNSPGGSVFEGLGIYDTLAKHDAKVNIHVSALAASMGSVIMQAGDSVTIAEIGAVMIHNPSNIVWGSADELRKQAAALDKHKSAMLAAYQGRGRLQLSEEELSEAMDEETWYTAEEAVEFGFADEVVAADFSAVASALASFDLSKYRNAPSELLARAKSTSKKKPSKRGKKSASKRKLNEPKGNEPMTDFTQAELDAAVKAAREAALQEARDANATAVSEAVAANNARYTTLAAHKNGSNITAVARLAKSSLPIEEALEMMDDVVPSGAAESTPTDIAAFEAAATEAANKAAAAAVAALRAKKSDTGNLETDAPEGGDPDEQDAVAVEKARVEAANARRAKRNGSVK